MQQLTLSYLVKVDRICLALKKRGFGEGNWNGYGGKLEEGETSREAAIREIKEESLIQVKLGDLEVMAVIEFIFEDGRHLEVHTFFVRRWAGEPKETGEMRPRWFHFYEIPYEKMWEDDRYWLPRALLGEQLRGKVWFDGSDTRIKQMEWQRVDAF
jgi:ADP-ribose pyrophosphatase YjhB (NUDIX family)